MNQEDLIQRLSELSGMTRAIYCISEDQSIDTIAVNLEQALDDIVARLQSEQYLEWNSRFPHTFPCSHEWKPLCNSSEMFCPKCGERSE